MKIWIFKMFEKYGNVCLSCWCVLYYKLLFLMRLSDSVSFAVYMNMFKDVFYIFWKLSRSVNNFRTTFFYFQKNILVFSAVNITGMFGGKYYWYYRREILLVWSAGNITGVVGGKYYWYFSGGDTIAYIYIYIYIYIYNI